MLKRIIVLVSLMAVATFAAAKGVYLSAEQFISSVFPAGKATVQTLWLKGESRSQAETILNRSLGLRTRYWTDGTRTAWILEEIGKEMPITIGVVVAGDHIIDVRIMAYRESRGGEVRYPFFTNQYSGLSLQKDLSLTDMIDGISGATLSVRAVTRIARAALYFHRQVIESITEVGKDPTLNAQTAKISQ
ncbi:MAG: FMN-binding protein [Pseudomonadales bacterium]